MNGQSSPPSPGRHDGHMPPVGPGRQSGGQSGGRHLSGTCRGPPLLSFPSERRGTPIPGWDSRCLEDVLSLEKLAVFPMGEARRSGQFFRGIWARQGGAAQGRGRAGPGWSAAPQGRPPPALLCPKAPTRGRTCSGPHIRGCTGGRAGSAVSLPHVDSELDARPTSGSEDCSLYLAV